MYVQPRAHLRRHNYANKNCTPGIQEVGFSVYKRNIAMKCEDCINEDFTIHVIFKTKNDTIAHLNDKNARVYIFCGVFALISKL